MPVRKHFRPGGTAYQRRRRPMHGTPLHICRRRFTVDGIAEHVEHARENALADRCLQRPAGVFHRHATRQALGGGQRNATHAMRIQLRQHFDDDLLLLARAQHRVDRWQLRIESYVHDTAAHGDDHAGIRCAGVACHFPARFHHTMPSLPLRTKQARIRALRARASAAFQSARDHGWIRCCDRPARQSTAPVRRVLVSGSG